MLAVTLDYSYKGMCLRFVQPVTLRLSSCAQHQSRLSLKILSMDDTTVLNQPLLFGWVDYFLFALTLLVSLLIGVYHAWRGGNSTSEYLLAGKSMGVFPIAMSLAARLLTCVLVSEQTLYRSFLNSSCP